MSVPGKGKLTAVATLAKKTIGKASKTVSKAGTASLKVPVKKKGQAKVKVTFPLSSSAMNLTGTPRPSSQTVYLVAPSTSKRCPRK